MILLNRFYGYIKKDFLLFYKRKKYLTLFIGIPLVLTLFFILSLNPSEYVIRTGVCDNDISDLSRSAISNMPNFKYTLLEKENCTENLKKLIALKSYDLGIEIPTGFEREINSLKQSRVIVYYDNTDVAFSNLISWKVDSALYGFKRQIIDSLNKELKSKTNSISSNLDIILELSSFSSSLEKRVIKMGDDLKNLNEMDTEFLVNPIWTDQKPIYESKLNKSTSIVYVFPIISIFTILMLSSISIIYDKKSGFLLRVKSGSSGLSYLISKTLFFIILVTLQFLLVLLIFLINGGRYSFNLSGIVLLITSTALINCLIGFIIGIISENEGIAVLFSLIISFPLMLISGIFFPIQTLPKFFQYLSLFTPLSYQISYSKAVLLFNQAFNNIWVFFSVILFILCWWFIKKQN